MIESLFGIEPREIKDKRLAFNEAFNRVSKKVRDSNSDISMPVSFNFPESFTQQSKQISRGTFEWRQFFSSDDMNIHSAHCRANRGSILKEHIHPDVDTYIYVVTGKLINWNGNDLKGKIIVPPENVRKPLSQTVYKSADVKGWHKVPAGERHMIQVLQDNTNFILKFIKTDESNHE